MKLMVSSGKLVDSELYILVKSICNYIVNTIDSK